MRTWFVLGLFAVAAAAQGSLRDLERAQAHFAKGVKTFESLKKAKTNGQRIRTLRRAAYFYGRARSLTEAGAEKDPIFAKVFKESTAGLVAALNDESKVHYKRKSLPLAKRRNQEALKLAPKDADAKKMARLIKVAEDDGLWVDDPDGPADPVRFRTGLPLAKEKRGGKSK